MSNSNVCPEMDMQTLGLVYRSLKELKPYEGNPRTHSKKQIEQIARSIKTFGFTNPILLDDNSMIIAGHGRAEAAKSLGIENVPTILLNGMTPAQKRAYIIADNKLAENAGWDRELLASEFLYLSSIDEEFDLTLTGFEIPEIDILIEEADLDFSNKEEDVIPEIPIKPITQPGDVWVLGDHKIICGNSLDPKVYEKLMSGEKAGMVFSDPPYNVPIEGHVCGAGTVHHKDFSMACGEMSEKEFEAFLSKAFSNLISYSKEGSIHFICMDWRHVAEVLSAGRLYTEYKNLCVWNKTNGGMGSLYRSKHELIFVFKNGKSPHINNVQLGEYGRYRTNVWDYAGVNTFKENRMEELSSHPTVKPIDLVADAILDCSKRGDIILDNFGGSGTTILAAHKTGRIARLIEMDPAYVDLTILRFQGNFSIEAVLEGTGQRYSEIRAFRGGHDE